MDNELPVVWVLEGEKKGDNAQANELARRLRAAIYIKRLRYNTLCRLPNHLLGAGLLTLDKRNSDDLSAPWPDLIIGVGRRSVPVARWIRQQAQGRTRLVHMGRPRAASDLFDLVITTPQYGLPSAPNLIELTLPLIRDLPLPDAELQNWLGEFAEMPRPRIVVLIGGPMRPLLMRKSEILKLSQEAEQLRRKLQGSVIAVCSPRTPPDALDGWEREFGAHRLFRWDPRRPNPYRAVLEIADRFIVTSDSVSMLAEAARTTKRVDVYRLPARRTFRIPLYSWPFSELVRRGFLATRRDVDSLICKLVVGRHIGVLGEEDVALLAIPREEDRAIIRVQALLRKQATDDRS